MAFKKFSKKPKRVFAKKTYAKKAYKKSNLKATISKVLNSKVETKTTGQDPVSYTWNANNLLMSPSIALTDALDMSQGTTDGTRIGNKITVTSAILNLNITANSNALATPPTIISIYIGYKKADRGSNITAPELLRFFNDGASSVGQTGTTLDLLRNINRDEFVVVKRMDMKIGSASNEDLAIQYNNNDFPYFINKKIRLPSMEGIVTFTRDATTGSHNKQLYMWATWTVVTSASNAFPPVFNYYMDIKYKDM